MNSKSLRRLAADHASLHKSGLPPNYLFPPSTTTRAADDLDDAEDVDDDPGIPDDLTQLDVLLAGPAGTPFSAAVFRLHLEIPTTYPTAPPTATFRTPIFHPNVDPASGAVCVDTLKRDWQASLTLRHVLVTITCLLVYPNPASALNAEAGRLVTEDWTAFERRARLMAGVHAGVPKAIARRVEEARRKGEEGAGGARTEKEGRVERPVTAASRSDGKAACAQGVQSGGGALPKPRPAPSEEEENAGVSTAVPHTTATPLGAGSDNIFGIRSVPDTDDATSSSAALKQHNLAASAILPAPTPMELDDPPSASAPAALTTPPQHTITPRSTASAHHARQRYATFPPHRHGAPTSTRPPTRTSPLAAARHAVQPPPTTTRVETSTASASNRARPPPSTAYLDWVLRAAADAAASEKQCSGGVARSEEERRLLRRLAREMGGGVGGGGGAAGAVRRWNRGAWGPRTGVRRL